jgi:TRAP-type C4-dicarboxylate transport system permease small subunit
MEGQVRPMAARDANAGGAYARLRRVIDAVDGVLMLVGCLMLFALMLVVVSDVTLRYLFNAPLQWSYEVISSYLMPGLFFMAVSHTLKANAHVSVDILHNYVTRRTRYVFEAICSVVALPVFALCTWVSAQHTWNDFQTAATSTSGLAVPTWTISLMLPIGFGLLSLRLFLNAGGFIASLLTGREVTPLPPISGTEELTP